MDALPPRLTPEEEGSFQYLRIKDQTPPILTKAIDALHRHKSEFFEKHGEEGTEAEKKAISLLSKLRNELQTDKPFLPLTDNSADTDVWNQYLEYHHSLLNENNKKIVLWGNKCDLALSPDESIPETSSPVVTLEDLQLFILVDNMDHVWSLLINRKKMRQETFPVTRVDFIMDNAGFELVADLVMADFLLASKLATEIHFHGKSIPWFVSNTIKKDMDWVIEQLKAANTKCMSDCGINWEHYLKHTWIYQDHMFWTLPHEYCTMSQVSPDLYAELQKSNLILFKGDLNYRKLVGDRKWKLTVPFHQALNGFHPAPLCSIRTVKTEALVGLAHGQGRHVAGIDPQWRTSGKFGVFQFDGSL
ncbi:damage-control phosphatase ARMT1-like isoform X2 [Phascolarctos cinereus]|uniref:Sugar phosphate phosphatase n=1 Tax=Phascolarctos cinereus TaxID=38626 RepID=A0A6P5K9U7_PHACI|nr:protein-glutamate O-methyltransferase-like isoform X2 [Phascolarctos cinereus]